MSPLKTSRLAFKAFVFITFVAVSLFNLVYAQDLPATYESDFKTDYHYEPKSYYGTEQPSELILDQRLADYLSNIEGRPINSNHVRGFGNLHVVIESIEALNHSVISKKADRVEIWLGHLLLAKMEKDDKKVLDLNSSRTFDFPLITLKTGYYFISIRLYSKGFLWKNKKFHEQIYQVGVHEGKLTTLRRKIPHLNW